MIASPGSTTESSAASRHRPQHRPSRAHQRAGQDRGDAVGLPRPGAGRLSGTSCRGARRGGAYTIAMIIPCLDLMDGKVVQLVQGRDKALEEADPLAVLERFAPFREIQVVDLDAALGRGSNDGLVRRLAADATARVGGGVRSAERARTLVEQGAASVIVGTAAFTPEVAERLASRCASALGEQLVAAILHGSLTLGDFTPGRGDVDLLLVVERPLSDKQQV